VGCPKDNYNESKFINLSMKFIVQGKYFKIENFFEDFDS